MKKNKQLICLIGALAVGIATIAGCSGERRNPFSENPVETGAYLDMTQIDSGAAGYMTRNGMMNGVIQLSDPQKTEIDSLYRYYRRLVRHEWKEEGALYDSLQVAVMNVLTTGQKNLLDSVEAQLEAGIIPDTLVAKRLADLTALLSLTADQQTRAFPILKNDMQAQLDTLIADSTEIRRMIAQHRHHRWLLKGEKLGLPDAFWNLLTDSQKRILFREERFVRRG
jgi:hypothetical protein